MAVLGVGLAGLLAAVAASVLFARLVRDSRRPRAAALLGAAFWVADVVCGRTTFALGAVAGLAAVLLLPRLRWALPLAVLTGLLSPVAAAFVGFVAAVRVLHRLPGGWSLGIASVVPVALLAVLFPGGGVQPFSWDSALPAAAVALALAWLTAVPEVRTASLLYAGAVLLFAWHHDPFGSNVMRLGSIVAAPVLLATSRRGTALLAVATVGFLSWQVDAPSGDLLAPKGPPLAALTRELVSLGAQRVEVVAPRDHREAWRVAERVPLARGWARQTDLHDNPLFYSGTLTPQAFRAWLRAHAVDHVAVPRRASLDYGATREGALLRGPVAGLEPVWQDADWTVLRVVDARPVAALPAVVVASERTRLVLRSDVPATVDVEVRWSRWLSLTGPGCLERSGERVRVRFASAGAVVLGSALRPAGHC
ncbi:MAG: hypothetical protein ACXVGH_04930 [Mycobacteriales bacterium]